MRERVGRLFFNCDNSEAFDMETGVWNMILLIKFAQETLDNLKSMGVERLPSAVEVANDFVSSV